MKYKRGLFVFEQDLRIQDNAALAKIAQSVERLDCVYIYDANLYTKPDHFNCRSRGTLPTLFLWQTLRELDRSLQTYGQNLKVIFGSHEHEIINYVTNKKIDYLVKGSSFGVNEQKLESQIFTSLEEINHQNSNKVKFESVWQHTLFEPEKIPFTVSDIPDVFSQFRRKIENEYLYITPPASITSLPKALSTRIEFPHQSRFGLDISQHGLTPVGGCISGLAHLDDYFSIDALHSYKQTRNELDDWYSSSKMSFWLANGSISAKQVSQRITDFEIKFGSNESTYWLKFELLWREFFHWHLEKHQQKVFAFSGISNKKPLTTFNAQRFAQWCAGNTPYPIVNAAMKQLNKTGYMSNRGRQIVASCLVNELALDWRYGAAYFQQQLIDYDVAANWGNWQYIAGVGTDPRGTRWFNITKQTDIYDPERIFINKWKGNITCPDIDQVDIVDWPLDIAGKGNSNVPR